ncbi:MAG: transporter, ATPase subunit [Candidatus Angelobacter sp.]|nr:transporter, ATPase subunit [Candidatus Angelobacter sp.]
MGLILSTTSNPSATNVSATAATGTATVIVDKVTKIFGRVAAIREVSFCFSARMMYVLLGDNGAGKSTLLRMIAGLSQPTMGSVELANVTREQVGYMAHASLLYDELTGMENLEYFARLHGIEEGRTACAPFAAEQQVGLNRRTICERAMTSVGLEPAMTRPVSAYSQGMRQRLSLARAVLHSPKVILLDEPFSNVDAASTAQMTKLLGELRDGGCTVIVVTHQVAALSHTGDEFLTMKLGKIVESRRRAQLRSTEVGL